MKVVETEKASFEYCVYRQTRLFYEATSILLYACCVDNIGMYVIRRFSEIREYFLPFALTNTYKMLRGDVMVSLYTLTIRIVAR